MAIHVYYYTCTLCVQYGIILYILCCMPYAIYCNNIAGLNITIAILEYVHVYYTCTSVSGVRQRDVPMHGCMILQYTRYTVYTQVRPAFIQYLLE